MSAAVGELISFRRASMRPRWSQRFLAEELTFRGYAATRSQIARLENAAPGQHNIELLAAAACVLSVMPEELHGAIIDDCKTVYRQVFEVLTPPH